MENKELEGLQQVKDYHVEAAKKLIAYADDSGLRESDVKHYRKRAEAHLEMVDQLNAVTQALYSAIDMATAAADGFRDGAKSVVVDLVPDEPADEGAAYLHEDFVKARIIAAGGSIKE